MNTDSEVKILIGRVNELEEQVEKLTEVVKQLVDLLPKERKNAFGGRLRL